MQTEQYKICNSCGVKNAIDESFCMECMSTDLSIIKDKTNTEDIKKENIVQKPIQTSHKICKNCGAKNAMKEPFCMECFGTDFDKYNDSSNEVSQEVESSITCDKNTDEKTIIESPNSILKLIYDEHELIVWHDDIIGREGKWSNILNNYKTVSRRHARFSFENDQSYIEDLGSANGSYINNIRIQTNQKIKIAHNDELKLSTALVLKVQVIV